MLRRSVVLLSALALFGCASDDDAVRTGGSTPCNPLEGTSEPLEIGEIVAVGRATDGKLYAIDRPAGGDELRVLESEGDFLFARALAGFAESSDGTSELTQLTVESAAFGYTLILEIVDGEVWLARVMGQFSDLRTVADASPDERLELVDPAELDELTPRAVATANVVVYLANVSNGGLLMMVGPPDVPDEVFDSYRVFYGDQRELIERGQLEIERVDDSGTTQMTFDLDGELAVATFPPFDESAGEVPVAMIQIGAAMHAVQMIDQDSVALGDTAFLCLSSEDAAP
jgi:hypothetical protein